ncbi:MAG: PfkB family carbohydrate kinase, partial [Ferrovibrio sp.]
MSQPRNNVLAIGNAIVDVLARVSDNFLDTHGMPKGGMTLIDGARAEQLYGEMQDSTEVSGGSAANTAAGIAALGGKVQFVGRVRNDALGNVFARDIKALGVQYDTAPA